MNLESFLHFFRHDWSKWSPVVKREYQPFIVNLKAPEGQRFYEEVQTRTCATCDKVQERVL